MAELMSHEFIMNSMNSIKTRRGKKRNKEEQGKKIKSTQKKKIVMVVRNE